MERGGLQQGGHLATCPCFPLGAPGVIFGSPVPRQTAVGGTSGNWPMGFALLVKESDIPGARLCLERCPSVRRAAEERGALCPPSQGRLDEQTGFINVFVDNVGHCHGMLFALGTGGSAPPARDEGAGDSRAGTRGQRESLRRAEYGELPPLVSVGE